MSGAGEIRCLAQALRDDLLHCFGQDALADNPRRQEAVAPLLSTAVGNGASTSGGWFRPFVNDSASEALSPMMLC